MKGLLGITGFKGRGFVKVWSGVFTHVTSIRGYDTAVGLTTIAALYFFRVGLTIIFKFFNLKSETERSRLVRGERSKSHPSQSHEENQMVVVHFRQLPGGGGVQPVGLGVLLRGSPTLPTDGRGGPWTAGLAAALAV